MIVYREYKTLEKDLGFPIKTLFALSNNIDKHYHNAFIPKSDGTKRKLSVPDLILKMVQRSIADNILAYYPVSKYAKVTLLERMCKRMQCHTLARKRY